MVTLQDIADRAGLSVSTVSRVLSGAKNTVPISEATCQRVLQLAEELEYYPNVAARALSSQRAGAIGLIIPVGDPTRNYQRFYGLKLQEVLAGIELVATEAHLNLILQVVNTLFLEKHGIKRMFKSRLVDTLIFYEVTLPPDEILAAYPTIFLNTHNGNENYVIADDFGGAQNAVDYLVALGHRRIGLISGPNSHFVSCERRRGYEAALAKHGLKLMIYEGDLSEESGVRGAQALLTNGERLTAIYAAGDYMAIGVLTTARRMGFSVPSQLSIMGADGMQVGAYTTPAITTVVTPLYSMSRLAAGWAVKLLNNEKEAKKPVQEICPTEIEQRESCGLAPND
jgi:LacI family transcriptional regulator